MYKKSSSFGNKLIETYNNNPDAIRIIFEYNLVNFPIDACDENNNTILHHCVFNNDEKILSIILNYILYDKSDYTNLVNFQNKDGDTAMHIAVRNNYLNCAKMLHKAGTDLNLMNSNGEMIEMEDSDSNKSVKDDSLSNIIEVNSLSDRFEKLLNKKNNSSGTSKKVIALSSENELDTQDFLNKLMLKLNLKGGRKKHRKSQRSKKRTKRSKRKLSPSNKAHEEVIMKAKTELKLDDEDAAALKSVLYKYVKTQYPNLSNKDRSFKMLELMNDKKVINEIKKDLSETKKIIAEHRKQKALKTASSTSTNSSEIMQVDHSKSTSNSSSKKK